MIKLRWKKGRKNTDGEGGSDGEMVLLFFLFLLWLLVVGGWIDAYESVQGMIKQINKLTIDNSGRYVDYAGKSINW